MEVNKPFETTDEDVEGLTALVDSHKEDMTAKTAALDSVIAVAEGELADAVLGETVSMPLALPPLKTVL